ncbi:procathepsin L-like [Culicoides brevitarsis]|uniref:procathepsin L-like n=1 Tax=Culicoides brevitarsis TaxID=469753 RepID=UPI00307B4E5F
MNFPWILVFLTFLKGTFALELDWNLPTDEILKQYETVKDQTETTGETFRKEILTKNIENVKAHNARYASGQETYLLGLNQFSDWTEIERKSVLGFKPPNAQSDEEVLPAVRGPVEDFFGMIMKFFQYFTQRFGICQLNFFTTSSDVAVDHRKKPCSGIVLNQGKCGSCYAFATTQVLDYNTCTKCGGKESRYSSEQNIVDCSESYGNSGCDGGLMVNSMQFIIDKKGIDTNLSYPYVAKKEECQATKDEASKDESSGYKATGFVNLPQDEDSILEAVKERIVYCAIKVTDNVYSYAKGVFSDTMSCPTPSMRLNHAIVIVGYGKDEETKKPYWIIKNSWSEKWGEEGYFRLERGCCCLGICLMCGYPEFECDGEGKIDPRNNERENSL